MMQKKITRLVDSCTETSNAEMLPIRLASIRTIASPLRYPGGKSSLSSFMADVVESCGCRRGLYVEPYSGGAGIALRLLFSGVVSKIVINDFDPAVYAFWNSAVNDSSNFLELFDSTEVTIEEWKRQKAILASPCNELELGFAFFFINRTSRSGVSTGGVIGGLNQAGRYRVDARYNRKALREKLRAIAAASASITVSNEDGAKVVEGISGCRNSFMYIDPPYVAKGKSLYMNSFGELSHSSLAEVLLSHQSSKWLLTYDDHPMIRELYGNNVIGTYALNYCAYRRRCASELMIASNFMKPRIDKLFKEA